MIRHANSWPDVLFRLAGDHDSVPGQGVNAQLQRSNKEAKQHHPVC